MGYVYIDGKRYYEDYKTGELSEVNSVVVPTNGEMYSRGMAVEKKTDDGFIKAFILAFGMFLLGATCILADSKIEQSKVTAVQTDAVESEIHQETARVEEPESVICETQEISDDYIMPDIDSRYLCNADIKHMDLDEIQMLINELYARHGHVFEKQDCRDYFSAKSWYHPMPNKSDEAIVNEFNKYESKNKDLLVAKRTELRGY